MFKDITGLRFGRLVALKPAGKRDCSENIHWKCKCDCGNEKIVSGVNLRSGNTKSCGCLAKENRIKAGKARRKYFKCSYCGSNEHYARGYCRSCYDKLRRGTLK